MTLALWRVVPLDPRAPQTAPGGALYCPRDLQGSGRHDDPERYGCLYVAQDPAAAVAEVLAPFRGSGPLREPMLQRAGRPLVLAALGGDDQLDLLDLDDPAVLQAESLRPSQVATRHRPATQKLARDLFAAHPGVHGLRWWSTLEASWINVTLFDRAIPRVFVDSTTPLTPDLPAVMDAAELLGLT
ncbi:MAG: RES family NAD+ phosphorylase [Solirubrobacteraceae bacterium]|nr:RES family NAD+ phosphorylase [Patulibacter sp.]